MDILQIIAVIALSAVFMLMLFAIKNAILKTGGKNGDAEVDFLVTGITDAEELESIVRSLIWQRSRIGLVSAILIVDDTLGNEARRMAQIFADENDFIRIVSGRKF